MAFEPLSFSSRGGSSITLDKQHRLRISSSALKELKLSAYQYVVISIDVENKRLGVARQELAKVPNASAVKVDKRGYLGIKAGKVVAEKLAIVDSDLPVKFEDIGWEDQTGVRWRAFQYEE